MTTVDFITALFYEIDEQLHAFPKHPEAHLWPSEVVTLGLLHALKGGGNRPFYQKPAEDHERQPVGECQKLKRITSFRVPRASARGYLPLVDARLSAVVPTAP